MYCYIRAHECVVSSSGKICAICLPIPCSSYSNAVSHAVDDGNVIAKILVALSVCSSKSIADFTVHYDLFTVIWYNIHAMFSKNAMALA